MDQFRKILTHSQSAGHSPPFCGFSDLIFTPPPQKYLRNARLISRKIPCSSFSLMHPSYGRPFRKPPGHLLPLFKSVFELGGIMPVISVLRMNHNHALFINQRNMDTILVDTSNLFRCHPFLKKVGPLKAHEQVIGLSRSIHPLHLKTWRHYPNYRSDL